MTSTRPSSSPIALATSAAVGARVVDHEHVGARYRHPQARVASNPLNLGTIRFRREGIRHAAPEGRQEEGVNDPLTKTETKAPKVPWQGSPE